MGNGETKRAMRLAKREIHDANELRAIVGACKVLRIGGHDDEGLFVVPVSFGYEWENESAVGGAEGNECEASNAGAAGQLKAASAGVNNQGAANVSAEDQSTANAQAEGQVSGKPQLTLWVHSAQEGRKAAYFDGEPTVAIEMDLDDGLITGDFACAYSEAYRSIMGTGAIHPVHDAATKRKALALIMQHSAPGSPVEFSDASVERVGIYRIDVDRFTGKMRNSL